MDNSDVDPQIRRLLGDLASQVRNRTLAEVYHNLQGKITTKDLADIYGVSRANISRIYRQYYPDHV